MDEFKFENDILNLLFEERIIEQKEKFAKIIIESDAKTIISIFLSYYIGDKFDTEIKESYLIDDASRYSIGDKLAKLLYSHQLIGKQSHMQDLKLILNAGERSILSLKEFVCPLEDTIFDK